MNMITQEMRHNYYWRNIQASKWKEKGHKTPDLIELLLFIYYGATENAELDIARPDNAAPESKGGQRETGQRETI